MDAGTFTDRVDGTGVLSQQAARDLGIVGMAARASGVDGDLRRDHPNDAYEGFVSTCPSKKVRCQGTAHGACTRDRAVAGDSAAGPRRAARHAARRALPDRLPASRGARVGRSVARAVHPLGGDGRPR